MTPAYVVSIYTVLTFFLSGVAVGVLVLLLVTGRWRKALDREKAANEAMDGLIGQQQRMNQEMFKRQLALEQGHALDNKRIEDLLDEIALLHQELSIAEASRRTEYSVIRLPIKREHTRRR